MSVFTIEITDHLPNPLVEHDFLKTVISRVLSDERIDSATISVAMVSDAEIHRVNREFLGHDYPTDVVSFLLNDPGESILNGELIVSTDTAIREASSHGWSPAAELLLYLVHGLLHLCGYDDVTDEARPAMRSRERELLALWGYCPTGLET